MDDAARTLRGYEASGLRPGEPATRTIRGSTTILEILRMYPDGRAASLMARLYWPCAHCSGAVREPLTLAAKRHARDPRAVLDAFRALDQGGPTPQQLERANVRVPRS